MKKIYFHNKSENRRYLNSIFHFLKQFYDESNDGLQIKSDRKKAITKPIITENCPYFNCQHYSTVQFVKKHKFNGVRKNKRYFCGNGNSIRID